MNKAVKICSLKLDVNLKKATKAFDSRHKMATKATKVTKLATKQATKATK